MTEVFLILIEALSLAAISKKKFNIRIKPSFIIKPIIASIVMVIYLFFFTRFVYTGINLVLIIFEVLTASIIYFITLYLIKGVSIREINYISQILKEILNKR